MMDDGLHEGATGDAPQDVELQWGVRIPLRDSVQLSATLYLPRGHRDPSSVIVTLTPYIAQTWHEQGMYFAAYGYPFLCVDVRGRGNSEGAFEPLINEANDAFDVIEWVARQSWCNGQVTMWGGSYAGYVQWAAAKEFPPHLATIVPVASPYIGVDFPLRGHTFKTYVMQWLTFVWGRTSQDRLFWSNERFWGGLFCRWFESGAPFKALDTALGNHSPVFQEWISHPERDEYWERYNPTAAQYAAVCLPILTITGIYDGDQPGALMHYRQHLKYASAAARARHYLVIGPWDHAGTRVPKLQFCGLTVGPESLIDLPKLHREWYAWTMQGGPKPAFLRKNVAYYVMGAETWRYADTLESVTVCSELLHLHSTSNPTDVFRSGLLNRELSPDSAPDYYIHDPRDVSLAQLERIVDPEDRSDQRLVHAAAGKQLVYHSEPVARDIEVSGFFRLVIWLSIDQPDTDFRASVYEVAGDGASILLSTDSMRARYRESSSEARLIRTTEPLRYELERFTFVSRVIRAGHRLRLIIGPINSIYWQKNHNSGGIVAEESIQDARPITVKLFHDAAHRSALQVPYGQPRA